MKLLVISHGLGAVDKQSFYAELEQQTGWTVTLTLPLRWKAQFGPIDMAQRWPGLRADIRHVDVISPGSLQRHLYRSWWVGLLREIAPDVIYLQQEPYSLATAQIYLANQLAGHRPIGFATAQNVPRRSPALTRALERWVLDHSDFAFPATEGALSQLRAKHYTGSAEVLPRPVDPAIYRPEPAWSASRRAIMGFAPDCVVFGYMGRLIEEKGLHTLLSAFEQMDGPRWELFLVGDGPLEGVLRSRVAASLRLRGHVHLAGVVPPAEAHCWLSLCDVVVLPSETRDRWREPSGRVLLEALASGTPVVGSDSGETPGILRATGGGLLFSEGDVAALAAALRRMATEPALRQQLAAAGAAAVAEQYAQPALVRRFATALEAAATAPR